jgi:hypothetical protein
LTDGENELLPPEPAAFSPVDGGGGALELGVSEVVSAGCSFVSEPQALNALIPAMPIAPTASANFRAKDDRMANEISYSPCSWRLRQITCLAAAAGQRKNPPPLSRIR